MKTAPTAAAGYLAIGDGTHLTKAEIKPRRDATQSAHFKVTGWGSGRRATTDSEMGKRISPKDSQGMEVLSTAEGVEEY